MRSRFPGEQRWKICIFTRCLEMNCVFSKDIFLKIMKIFFWKFVFNPKHTWHVCWSSFEAKKWWVFSINAYSVLRIKTVSPSGEVGCSIILTVSRILSSFYLSKFYCTFQMLPDRNSCRWQLFLCESAHNPEGFLVCYLMFFGDLRRNWTLTVLVSCRFTFIFGTKEIKLTEMSAGS